MDFRHLFITEPPLVSLAVAKSAVTVLRLEKSGKGFKRVFVRRQSIPDGVINEGKLQNIREFTRAVKACYDAISPKLLKKYSSVILTIPDDQVFIVRLEFPENLEEEEIRDYIEVNAPSQLPLPLAQSYFDFEHTTSFRKGKREILLAQIPSNVVDAYRTALEQLGLHLAAVEFESLSLFRTIRSFEQKPLFVFRETDTGYSGGLMLSKELHFFIHRRLITDPTNKQTKTNSLARAIQDLVYYIETDLNITVDSVLVGGPSDSQNESYLNDLKKDLADNGLSLSVEPLGKFIDNALVEGDQKNTDLLPALGVGLRSLISREDDTIISLMPVGTEESYRATRTMAYMRTLSDLVIALSVILVLLFGGVYIFLKTVSGPLHERFRDASDRPLAKGSQALEAEVKHVNALLADIGRITSSKRTMSPLFQALNQSVIAGITISGIQVTNLDAPVSVSAVAKTREQAIAFRDKLESSGVFTDIDLPISSLRSENNVSFQIAMKYQPKP